MSKSTNKPLLQRGLVDKVGHTIERFGLIEQDAKLMIALSGGVDSIVLTEVLVRLKESRGWTLAIAHLNHGLRAESDADEAFCRSVARNKGLPFFSERIDVRERARRAGRGIEEEGRLARLDFLRRTSRAEGFDRVALGHSQDDQAETFLLRLLRGAGSRGLAAAYPSLEGHFVRPLLDVLRQDIVAFAQQARLEHREDASNQDRRFTRNRLRLDTLPELRKTYNPNLSRTLAQSADIMREEDRFLSELARERFQAIIERHGTDRLRLSVSRLNELPLALRRRVIREVIEELRGDLRNVSSIHVHDVLELAREGKSGRELHIPSLLVHRDFEWLEFSPHLAVQNAPASSAGATKARYNEYEYELSIPASLRIPETGDHLRVDPWERQWSESAAKLEEWPPASGAYVVIGVDCELSKLTVRNPRPGDRFRPLGAPGSKSVARYLMERKVSRSRRRRIPVILDPEGRILWVAGFGVSEASRMGAQSRPIRLEWKVQ